VAFADILRFSELDVRGRRVMLRVDLVSSADLRRSEAQLRALRQTLDYLQEQRCKVIVAGDAEEPDALSTTIKALGFAGAHAPLLFERDFLTQIGSLAAGQVAFTPNLAELLPEAKDDPRWAWRLARVVDAYVNEAPRASRRARATTTTLPRLLATRGAGPLLGRDLDMTRDFVEVPSSPYVAVVGGGDLLAREPFLFGLLERVQALLLGGEVASTCLVARGWAPRATRYDAKAVPIAARLLEAAERRGVRVLLPTDGLVASRSGFVTRQLDQLPEGEGWIDVGHETWTAYADELSRAKTVLWAGVLGHPGSERSLQGTEIVAEAIANVEYSGVVGWESVALANQLGLGGKMLWLGSSGEGSLELMAGIVSPGIEALRQPPPPASEPSEST
jgi:3-phosphoglycerate kinase